MQEKRYSANRTFKAQANINQKKYERLITSFKNNANAFWSDLAKDNIYWKEKFKEIFSYTEKPFFQWFGGGKTNISYNCIDRHLEDKPNKTAIIFETESGDKKKLSYIELHTEVCKAANILKRLGVKKGDFVCIYMPSCPESIIAMQACNRIGAVHSVVFAGFSAQALKDRIEDLNCRFIITADGLFRRGKKILLLDSVYKACQNLNCIEKILCLNRIKENLKFNSKTFDWQEEMEKESSQCEPEWLESEDSSFVLYTSGSTGKPKGIQHTTAGYLLWAHLTCKWVFDLKDSDIYWCSADIGWITGHSYLCYGPLSNGATIFIYDGTPNYPDEARFWKMIEDYKITIFYTAPTAIRAFMQWGIEHVKKHDLSSLRLLGSVGEPINPSAWEWFYNEIGNSVCPICDTWWQTETGGIMITTFPGLDDMKPGSAGLVLPGVEAEISEDGLLYLSKPLPSMARNIQGDKQRYIDSYWSTGKYLTGDSASQDSDGYIKIEGRIDDVINISGHRLGTAEIESALVAHKAVTEAAVVAIPHEIKGNTIVAFVVIYQRKQVKPDSKAKEASKILTKDSLSSLQNHSLEEILKNQVVNEIGAIARPEKIIIVPALPKTRSGKIMRRLLKDLAQGKEIHGDLSTIEDKNVVQDLAQQVSMVNTYPEGSELRLGLIDT